MSKKSPKKIEPPEPPKIALLCPESMPGVSTVMRNMAAIKSDYCEFFPIISPEVKDLPDQFHSSPLVILGGWLPDFYPILCRRRNGVSVLLCSSMGQIDLSGVEMKFFQQIHDLQRKGHIDRIIVGSYEVFVAFRRGIQKLEWMPYPINIKEYGKFTYKPKVINNIGLFMPLHGRKNILNQIYSIAEVSAIHTERKLAPIQLKTNIKIDLPGLHTSYTSWPERKQYFKIIKDLKMGMHVTFTESFGYGALDYLLSGVPVLMSTTVGFNLRVPQDYEWGNLIILNSDSIREITNAIMDIIALDEEDYKQLCSGVWVHSREMSKKQNLQFAHFIEQFAGASEEISSKT